MARVCENLQAVLSTLPQGVGLVAVSKFCPEEAIAEAYRCGQRAFGESRVQELERKAAALPADIAWHFIGHLQTNKVRALVALSPLIESVDSERLLRIIDSESLRAGKVTSVLLEVHVAREQTKTGFIPSELEALLAAGMHRTLKAVKIRGIMGMASNTDDTDRIRADFAAIAACKERIAALCPDLTDFDLLSMGMSGDYPLAIAAGANLVRVGTAIFGARATYPTINQ